MEDGFESAFQAGVELIRAGEYFAAHEELEDAWRAAPAEERDFFQGLVHVAVAWYQAGRGRKIGTERQLAKAIAAELRPHGLERRCAGWRRTRPLIAASSSSRCSPNSASCTSRAR